ncbi:MAG: putative dehydrogenase [Limisphaerales bacterium]|jgi:predicted dehydrogenase
MTRRDFLQTSASLVATAPLLRAESASVTAPIKIGFLGGSHSHGLGKAKVLQQNADWDIVGVVDASPEVLARYAKLGIKSITQEELLAQAQVVVVESDVADHYAHGKLALEAGKHLHIEKPPTMTLDEFRELLGIAKSEKLLMQMGYMWRFNPGVVAALNAATEGWLGEVYMVKAEINKLMTKESRPELAFQGGSMFELGCHIIDPVVRLLGRPEKVTTHLKSSGGYNDHIVDNAIAIFDYPNATAIVGSAVVHPRGGAYRHLYIYGTNGTIRVEPLDRPVMTVELNDAAGPYKAGMQTVNFDPYSRYVGEFRELASAIRSGKQLGVTPEADLLVHEALLRACDIIVGD